MPITVSYTHLLVNAAGFGKTGTVEEIAKEDKKLQLRMIDLNCRGLTEMTCTCLPWMHKGTRIINLASAAAFCPQAKFAVYAATKSYVLSFSRSLAAELKEKGIFVTAVCPGPVSYTHLISMERSARSRIWTVCMMQRFWNRMKR